MCSHVYFGRTFASNPMYRIRWSISYSPICTVSLISLPVLLLLFPVFHTTRSSPHVVLSHLLMSSYNPFTALLSCNSFMHASRNVVSIDGSISSSSLYFLHEVEASLKPFFASIKFSRACSKSNYTSFDRVLQTQVLSSGCPPLPSLVIIPLQRIIFTFGSPSCGPNLIICRF